MLFQVEWRGDLEQSDFAYRNEFLVFGVILAAMQALDEISFDNDLIVIFIKIKKESLGQLSFNF